jgi:peptide-methionine (S)-S-oxide reductase
MKKILMIGLLFSFLGTACSQQQKSLNGEGKKLNPTIEDYVENKGYENYEIATFAGGCFWCIEAAFIRINGVVDAISGYSGGTTKHPTYYEVGGSKTGHAESVRIYYDPEVVSFETLLKVFFTAHDPRFPNREGNDVGPEYRSAIFYHTEAQKTASEAFIKQLLEEGTFDRIATEVTAYSSFWVAEDYHQDYYEHNPGNSYVRNVSKPKVEAVKKQFADLLKKQYTNR